MKNKDDLVSANIGVWTDTFVGQVRAYAQTNDLIKDIKQQLNVYNEQLKNDNFTNKKFGFKEALELYRILDGLKLEKRDGNGNCEYLGIDLSNLQRKLYFDFEDVRKYIDLKNELSLLERDLSTILYENINFDFFGISQNHDGECCDKHYLVKLDDELVCLNCKATTKDYSMTKEEVEFLTLAAEKHGLLLKEVTKEDIPLLAVLKAEKNYQKSKRKPLDEVDENEYLDYAEEYWLIDESEINDIRREIQKAHMLDSRNLEGLPKVSNPKYLTDEKAKELLLEIKEELKRINLLNTRFKNLLLENCRTIIYEILILAGDHIPTLMNKAKTEDDKIALTKAYYNLSNVNFRVNSGYFNSANRNWDALAYDCRTANPEINQKVLEIKLKK